jgi:hypothetical protein
MGCVKSSEADDAQEEALVMVIRAHSLRIIKAK